MHPNETLAVCYYLYSFEGALTDKHWNELGEDRKQQFKTQKRKRHIRHKRVIAVWMALVRLYRFDLNVL